MSSDQKNLFVSEGLIAPAPRWPLAGRKVCVVWFTGIDAPYEAPETPDLHGRMAEAGSGDGVAQIVAYLLPRVPLAAV